MPEPAVPSRGPRTDLRSAASGAAIELDNIFLKRKFKTSAIQLLAELLSSDIPAVEERNSPISLITPTVIVMDRVVRSKNPSARITDVIASLESVVGNLRQVAADPNSVSNDNPELVERLRTDCLDLSRFAPHLRALHRQDRLHYHP